MKELCSKLEKDVEDIDSVNNGLETRGAGLISRASELHARLESCGARALKQVTDPALWFPLPLQSYYPHALKIHVLNAVKQSFVTSKGSSVVAKCIHKF